MEPRRVLEAAKRCARKFVLRDVRYWAPASCERIGGIFRLQGLEARMRSGLPLRISELLLLAVAGAHGQNTGSVLILDTTRKILWSCVMPKIWIRC